MYHLAGSFAAVIGLCASGFALLGERYKWPSFATFSVATKVPVEIFCISGPIVMVTAFLYAMMAFLLATERATSTVFYIILIWTIIFFDMSIILYKEWKDMIKSAIDMCLHLVNISILVNSFVYMPYVPTTFLLITSGSWGVLNLSRLIKRLVEKDRVNSSSLPGGEFSRVSTSDSNETRIGYVSGMR